MEKGEYMKSIYSYTFEDFENYFLSKGDKKFRAVQIYDWIYKKRESRHSSITAK